MVRFDLGEKIYFKKRIIITIDSVSTQCIPGWDIVEALISSPSRFKRG